MNPACQTERQRDILYSLYDFPFPGGYFRNREENNECVWPGRPHSSFPGKGCVGTDPASRRQAQEGLGQAVPRVSFKTGPHSHLPLLRHTTSIGGRAHTVGAGLRGPWAAPPPSHCWVEALALWEAAECTGGATGQCHTSLSALDTKHIIVWRKEHS